jgi:hypothetical protein
MYLSEGGFPPARGVGSTHPLPRACGSGLTVGSEAGAIIKVSDGTLSLTCHFFDVRARVGRLTELERPNVRKSRPLECYPRPKTGHDGSWTQKRFPLWQG